MTDYSRTQAAERAGIGQVELKGVPGAMDLYAARRGWGPPRGPALDASQPAYD